MALKPEDRVMVLAPVVRGRKGEFKQEIEKLAQHGFTRARIDGELVNFEDEIALDKRKNHTIEVVIDRLLVKPGIEQRLEMSVGLAMKLAGGLVQVAIVGGEEQLYSERLACPDCGIDVPKLEPRSFSFNSAYGACPECHGLGSTYDFDPAKIINDWSKPLLDGALGPGSASQNLIHQINIVAAAFGIDLSTPFEKLPERIQNLFFYGEPEGRGKTGFLGIFGYLKNGLNEASSENYRDWLMEHMSATECPACHGKRLRPESLAVQVEGVSIADFTAMPVSRALEKARSIKLAGRELQIAGRIMHEIVERLQFLNAVGLGYISLDRSAATLSGGEGQRIRLATQIGSKLRGVLYVLDEPSIGLHHRDNGRLLNALEELRDLGNTVLVVEHDEETIRRADYVVDLGPGAGRHGGEIVARGTPGGVMLAPESVTGAIVVGGKRSEARPESRERGYKPGRFSFNVTGGRCEACQGEGQRRIEMNFLPDVYVVCEVCGGRRYNQETLAVKYKGHSIADLLETPVSEALPILENIPQVKQKLQTLVDVGLGYVHLGQSAVTLSGGEAQRIKLARELSKRQTGRTLYLLDEPTTGLHFDDVRKLLDVLHRLTDLGNTIIVIEHNLDVIRNADWIIDLGPEGGEEGGRLVAQGTPEQVARNKKSYTGQALANYFAGSRRRVLISQESAVS